MMDANATHFAYCSTDHIVIRSFEKPHQVSVFRGHQKPTALRLCPSAPLVASGDQDGTVKVWNLEDPSIVRYEGQKFSGKISDISWSADGQRLLICGKGRSVHAVVIMADGGSMVGELKGFTAEVVSGDFRPSRPFKMVCASEDRQVGLWKGPPIKEEWRALATDVLVRMTRFSPDGKFFILAGMGKMIGYDADSGERAFELPAEHKGAIQAIAWSADSTQLISAATDQTVKLWDIATAAVIETFTFTDCEGPDSIAFQQLGACWGAGGQMVSCSLNGNVNLLNPAQPNNATVIAGLAGNVEQMAVDLNASPPVVYASGASDGVCKVVGYRPAETVDNLYCDGTGAICTIPGVGPDRSVSGMSCREGLLVTVSMDGCLCVADVTDPGAPKFVTQVGGLDVPTGQCALGPGGVCYVATGAQGGSALSIHSAEASFEKGFSLSVGYDPLSMAIDTEGTTLAVSQDTVRNSKQHVYVYAVTAGSIEQSHVIDGTRHIARALAFSPDGSFLAAGDDNKEVRFYNKDKEWAPEVEDYIFHGGRVMDLAWHPSGDRCVSIALDKGVLVHKLDKLNRPAIFQRATPSGITRVEFFNEDLLVLGGVDGTVCTFEFTKNQ